MSDNKMMGVVLFISKATTLANKLLEYVEKRHYDLLTATGSSYFVFRSLSNRLKETLSPEEYEAFMEDLKLMVESSDVEFKEKESVYEEQSTKQEAEIISLESYKKKRNSNN